jgi:hypothetical protein
MKVIMEEVFVEAKDNPFKGIRTVVRRRGKKMVYYWSWRLEPVQDFETEFFIDDDFLNEICDNLIEEMKVS